MIEKLRAKKFDEIMSDTCINLQYIFACMTTHSKCVASIMNDFNKIHTYFDLSEHDKLLLHAFLRKDGEKLWAAAILMEEKRWREFLLTIKYMLALIPEKKLKYHWEDYLNSFDMQDAIPKSPALESINFLKYFIEKHKNNDSLNQITEYELLRNSVTLFEFPKNWKKNIANIDAIDNDLSSYKVIINPSLIIKKFEFSVSKIIEMIKSHSFIEMSKDEFMINSEMHIFFKNNETQYVKCMQVNDYFVSFLLNLVKFNNIYSWVKNLKNNERINIEKNIQYLKYMHSSGVIEAFKIK